MRQDWYEDGGVVYQGIYLILFLPLYELMKVFPYSTFLSRYVHTHASCGAPTSALRAYHCARRGHEEAASDRQHAQSWAPVRWRSG